MTFVNFVKMTAPHRAVKSLPGIVHCIQQPLRLLLFILYLILYWKQQYYLIYDLI